jgi:long-chain acyl-CoA synthetase
MSKAGSEKGYTRSEESYLNHVRGLQAALWPADVPRAPVYPHGRRPLTHYLDEWARRQPEKPAVLFYGHATSYAELDRLSNKFASLLKRLGASKGDRVAVFLPNCPQFYICFFGILKAGCVHVPVNPMFTRPELAYEINDTQARIVVAHDQLAHLVEEVREECGIAQLIVTGFSDVLGPNLEGPLPPALTAPRITIANSIDLMSALAQETSAPPLVDVGLDDVAALNYTGGTTGMPKGCVHTQFDMLFTGAVMGSVSMTVTADDVIINFWPIFWMAGEDLGVVLPVVTGATCVLLARWDPVAYMLAVQRHRATVSNMVVDNAVEIMNRPDAGQYDLTSLREVMVASFVKKLNPIFREGWRKLTGTVLREAAWGMTETHSYDAFNRGFQDDDRDLKQRQIFCGIPVSETDFKILEFGSDAASAWRGGRIVRTHAVAAQRLLEQAGCDGRRTCEWLVKNR